MSMIQGSNQVWFGPFKSLHDYYVGYQLFFERFIDRKELESSMTNLRDYNFNVKYDVTIFKERHAEFTSTMLLVSSSSQSSCARVASRLILFHAHSLT